MSFYYILLFSILISGCVKKQEVQPRIQNKSAFDANIPNNPHLPFNEDAASITTPAELVEGEGVTEQPATKANILELATKELTVDKIRSDLEFVSSDASYGRLPGSQGHANVINYLKTELSNMGLQTYFGSSYTQDFSINLNNTLVQTQNVVGIIPGSDPELSKKVIVLGAHFDHVGSVLRGYNCQQKDREFGFVSNEVCNGADDNASGTVALLNITRALLKVKEHLKKTVIIAWFSAEEEGLKGSRFFMENPTRNDLDYVFMMNFDMIGHLRENNQVLLANDLLDSKVVSDLVQKTDAKYESFRVQLPTSPEPFGRSDHSSFSVNGTPVVHFFTGLQASPLYHSTADKSSTIDFKGIETISKFSIDLIYDLATTIEIEPPAYIYDPVLKRNIKQPLIDKELAKKSCHDFIGQEQKMLEYFKNGPTK